MGGGRGAGGARRDANHADHVHQPGPGPASRRPRERLAEQAASLARSPVGAIRRGAGVRPDDWALVGEPEAVRDRIEACRERFAMTHLVASRTRLPGLEPGDFERSLEHLAALRESFGG